MMALLPCSRPPGLVLVILFLDQMSLFKTEFLILGMEMLFWQLRSSSVNAGHKGGNEIAIC